MDLFFMKFNYYKNLATESASDTATRTVTKRGKQNYGQYDVMPFQSRVAARIEFKSLMQGKQRRPQ